MLVILEGADGSGKTTLMQQLLEKGFTCKKTLRGENRERLMRLYNETMSSNSLIVIDRSFISDIVYRCNDDLPREGLDANEAIQILDKGCRIVYCKTDSQYDDSIRRGEDNITSYSKSEQISKTYDLFMTFAKKYTNTKVFEYDWHNQTVDDVVDFILEGCTNAIRQLYNS